MDGLCAGIALIAGATLLVGLCSARRVRRPSTRVSGDPARRDRRLPRPQLSPRVHLHGRRRQPLSWLELAALTLSMDGRRDRSLERAVRSSWPRSSSLLIPIFDTTLVTLSRLVSGRRVSQGGRDHSSHRLVAIGLSERAAVGVLLGLSLARRRVVASRSAGSPSAGRDFSHRAFIVAHGRYSPPISRRCASITTRRGACRARAHAGRRRLHAQAARRRGPARLLPRDHLLLRRLAAAVRRIHECAAATSIDFSSRCRSFSPFS